MSNSRLRVLYLSNAFPPGVGGRFPSVNPAGHPQETRMAQALARKTDLVSVGLLPQEVWGQLEPKDDSIGLDHKLLLWERPPELWHRWWSWRQLRMFYLMEFVRNGMPDVVLVRNLTPVFNHFVKWLRAQRPRPAIVLVFADSSTFGKKVSAWRKFRYSFKPMQTLNDDAMLLYDACISFGVGTRSFFDERNIPWMWMASSFNFSYDPPPPDPARTGPIRFGYFGALAEHAHILPTVKIFLDSKVPGSLRVCGFGKLADDLKALAGQHPNFHFDGVMKQQECLAWAQQVDVLINPRLAIWGLENSFPSKVFEYAMTGKAILSTRTGGVDRVLEENGLYLDAENFESSLREKLKEVSALPRTELQRRGTAIRTHVLKNFNWDEQARRMVEFMDGVVSSTEGRRK